MTQPNRNAPARPRTSLEIVPVDPKTGAMQFTNGAQLEALAERFANSPFAPAKIRGNVDACTAVIVVGAAIGLDPAMAMQSIDMIEQWDGSVKPRVPGEVYMAVMRNQPDLEEIEYGHRGVEFEDTYEAYITTKRRGFKATTDTFSVADAKRAGLWGGQTKSGKPTNWSMYPKDQLFWKALARHGRRAWADRMKGFAPREDTDAIESDEVRVVNARNVTPVRVISDDGGPVPASRSVDPLFEDTDLGAVEEAGAPGVPADDDSSAHPEEDLLLERESKLADLRAAMEQQAARLGTTPGEFARTVMAACEVDPAQDFTLEQIKAMLAACATVED